MLVKITFSDPIILAVEWRPAAEAMLASALRPEGIAGPELSTALTAEGAESCSLGATGARDSQGQGQPAPERWNSLNPWKSQGTARIYLQCILLLLGLFLSHTHTHTDTDTDRHIDTHRKIKVLGWI